MERLERQSTEAQLSEPVSSLSVELQRISAEIQSINAGFQAQLQRAISETHATVERHYRVRYEQSIEELREKLQREITQELQVEFEAEVNRRTAKFVTVREEFNRASAQLDAINAEIERLLDDPTSELSAVIRKRAEQVEVRSYLNGLRFIVGE